MINSRYPSKKGSTASLETALFPGWKRRKGENRLYNDSALRKEWRFFSCSPFFIKFFDNFSPVFPGNRALKAGVFGYDSL
jgi:hypothetical protein